MVTLDAQLFFLVSAALLAYLIYRGIRAYTGSRGTRIVECPETRKPAAVEVDAWLFASAKARGDHQLCLKDCSCWPERKDCDQACLTQIEAAPNGCLLRSTLEEWYSGKPCAICGNEFEEIRWHDHQPSLLDGAGELRTWASFAPEELVESLASLRPVCWDCQVAKNFRAKFPELVVDRPWRGYRD